jgi:hypothetical protein
MCRVQADLTKCLSNRVRLNDTEVPLIRLAPAGSLIGVGWGTNGKSHTKALYLDMACDNKGDLRLGILRLRLVPPV